MVASNKDIIQVLVFSTILIFLPLFVFPDKFGMGLASSSLTYSMLEIVFYGVVYYFFRPKVSLIQLFAGAGLTFLYRIVIGTIFGIILSLSFNMDMSISLTLGVSRYLPSILLQIVASPFIMRPFFLMIVDDQKSTRRRMPPSKPVSQNQLEPDSPAFKAKDEEEVVMAKPKAVHHEVDVANVAVNYNTNGFERAVKYIGEHHAVILAAVADWEGLPLASFKRQFEDPEHWSAYALLYQKVHNELLKKSGQNLEVDSINLTFGTNRLTIEKVDNFNLLVLSNNEEDELLNIRIAQGAEIIRKYSSERYGSILSAGTEEKYVSST